MNVQSFRENHILFIIFNNYLFFYYYLVSIGGNINRFHYHSCCRNKTTWYPINPRRPRNEGNPLPISFIPSDALKRTPDAKTNAKYNNICIFLPRSFRLRAEINRLLSVTWQTRIIPARPRGIASSTQRTFSG